MLSNPPLNSLIQIKQTVEGTHILIPAPKKGLAGIGKAAFLGFWLCGWAIGEFAAIATLITKGIHGTGWFILFWLGAWTVGGFFAGSAFLGLLFPAKGEEITISYEGLVHKNPKTKNYPKGQISNINKERIAGELKVTFDFGADRILLGDTLKEPEKDWLYEQLLHWRNS